MMNKVNKNKYRAWLIKERKMVDVNIIDFVNENIIFTSKENESDKNDSWKSNKRSFNEVILMQCLGFQVDGKDVYEGDILKHKDRYYFVEYDYESFDFYLYNKKYDDGFCMWNQYKYKHCGNIYENSFYLEFLGLEDED